jgi:hypothetical protein
MAWSYFLAFVGTVMQGLDSILDIINDQSFKDNIHGLIGNAQTFGRIILGISVINMISRLRTLRKTVTAPPPDPPLKGP